MALSPTELGPHDLLVHADGKLVGTHKLADPNREEHLFLEPTRAKACAAEQKAIADLRKAIGYSFRFRAEVGTDITYLYFPTADDIGALDPHLGGLKNLLSLYFQDGRLRGEGLKGERQHLIHLPHGLIVMSYLRSDGERSIRASYGSISFFESRMPLR